MRIYKRTEGDLMYWPLIKELTKLERLKLSYKYSISESHKRSLAERINKIENSQLSIFGEVQDGRKQLL